MVDGLGARGIGKRLDRDIDVYKSVWRGETPRGCDNPLLTEGSREVPLLFGGHPLSLIEFCAASGRR